MEAKPRYWYAYFTEEETTLTSPYPICSLTCRYSGRTTYSPFSTATSMGWRPIRPYLPSFIRLRAELGRTKTGGLRI
jgi:hypothetical protein